MRVLKPVMCAAIALLAGSAMPLTAADSEPEKRSVWSTIDLQLYGYVKLDASYDTGPANPGNFVRWIDLQPANQDDDEFNMTANQTRLGLWMRGPKDSEKPIQTAGRVEIDFYGGGEENKPRPMLRLAYIDLLWPNAGWRLLAGQAVDVISPLFPSTVNYPVQWWAGNIGYRRPQIRLSRYFSMSEAAAIKVAGAITRNIGTTDSLFANVDAGADAGLPGFQGRLAVQFGGSGGVDPSEIGLSGHWAEEEFDIDDAGAVETFDSWSANLDLLVPLRQGWTLKAEVYTGVNLAQYLGGIGQGVNLEKNLEIGDTGGWMSLQIGPFRDWTYHVGFSYSDVEDDDIELGDRSVNQAVFWNGIYDLTRHVQLDLELSYWETEYKVAEGEPGVADSLRTQFAIVYSF